MKVKFLETTIYETEGPGKGPKFEAGSVHDFREDIAERWIKRGKASLYTGKASTSADQQAKDPQNTSQSPADSTPADGLDDLTVPKLREKAAELKIDLGEATRKAEIIALIRATTVAAENRDDAPDTDDLDETSDDELLELVAELELDIGENAGRDEIVAAIRAAREAEQD